MFEAVVRLFVSLNDCSSFNRIIVLLLLNISIFVNFLDSCIIKSYIKNGLIFKWFDNLTYTCMFVTCRSQSLGDQLQVFEAEAAVLKSWLAAARSKLTSIKQLSSTDLRSIATVRNKIDKILVSSCRIKVMAGSSQI